MIGAETLTDRQEAESVRDSFKRHTDTDRWDSGSSQGSQRGKVVMSYMEGQMGRGASVASKTGAKLNKEERD